MSRGRRALARALLGATLVLAGCRAGADPPPSAVASVGATGASVAPSPATPSRAATSSVNASGPPSARLAAEGGDPVTGQVGSYVWHETGSDSPWLPGSLLTVGAGEPLSMTLDGGASVASWRARMVPADQTDPEGATSLGEGVGPPTFRAPGTGRWTVQVEVTLPDQAGTASYAWLLDVR
jgi:hypothetical protein